ncbi:MAG: transposase [Candidatus Freyarchaeota archaeon]
MHTIARKLGNSVPERKVLVGRKRPISSPGDPMNKVHRRRDSYYQDYFRARKPHFLRLIVFLVETLFKHSEDGQLESPRGRGRRRSYPMGKLVALAVIKQIIHCSYVFLEIVAPSLVGIAPDDNTIWRAATNPRLKPIIDEMSRKVAGMVVSLLPFPLLLLVTDSTGLAIPEKREKTRAMKRILKKAYQKLHITTTLFTNLILGCRLTPEDRNDSPVYRELMGSLSGFLRELYHLQKQILGVTVIHERVRGVLGSAASFIERLMGFLESSDAQFFLERIRRVGEFIGLSLGDSAYFNLKNLKSSLKEGLLPVFKPKARPEGEKENWLLARLRRMFSEAEEFYRYRGLVEAVFGNLWSRNSTSLSSRKEENREVEAAFMCFTHNLLILVQLLEKVCVDSVGEILRQQLVATPISYAALR